MEEVGFWRRFEDISVDPADSRPWPSVDVSAGYEINKSNIIEFLIRGAVESYELGYSTCRLCGSNSVEMGCITQTDGIFVWPEGLLHYVQNHNVQLPSKFLAHIEKSLPSLLKTPSFDRCDPSSPLLIWDNSRFNVATPATRAWIIENTLYGYGTFKKMPNHCFCLSI